MAVSNKNNKNGLVELFRFICSVWVAYYHGFFPVLSDKFDGVNISVDFFFLVSGLFFLKSIEKYREKPYLEGVRFIFWGRTKGFIVPLIIAALSVLYCNIMAPLDFGGFNWPFSFLWFFAAQFVFLSLFYLLRKITKRLSTFNVACVIIIGISMSLFRLEIEQLNIVMRGPAMLALGMLLSQIPRIKFNLKDETKSHRLTIFVNAFGFSVAAAAFVYLAYLPGFAIWRLHLFCCVVCPLLLYFATALPVRSRFMNLLGELSVFIYLGQCPILLHHYFVSGDTRDQFPWLVVCTVALFVLNRLINSRKAKAPKAA